MTATAKQLLPMYSRAILRHIKIIQKTDILIYTRTRAESTHPHLDYKCSNEVRRNNTDKCTNHIPNSNNQIDLIIQYRVIDFLTKFPFQAKLFMKLGELAPEISFFLLRFDGEGAVGFPLVHIRKIKNTEIHQKKEVPQCFHVHLRLLYIFHLKTSLRKSSY